MHVRVSEREKRQRDKEKRGVRDEEKEEIQRDRERKKDGGVVMMLLQYALK